METFEHVSKRARPAPIIIPPRVLEEKDFITPLRKIVVKTPNAPRKEKHSDNIFSS